MEELLEWPWLRFERFYHTFIVRLVIERMERQRDMIIAALHGNPVFDENEQAKRDEAVKNVENSFDEAMEYIKAKAAGEDVAQEDFDDYDPNDPFWAAAERGAAKLEATRADEGEEAVSAGEVVEGQQSLEEIREMLASLDQQ